MKDIKTVNNMVNLREYERPNYLKICEYKEKAVVLINQSNNLNYTREVLNESLMNMVTFQSSRIDSKIESIEIIDNSSDFIKICSTLEGKEVLYPSDESFSTCNFNIMGFYVIADIRNDRCLKIYVYINHDSDNNEVICDLYNIINDIKE